MNEAILPFKAKQSPTLRKPAHLGVVVQSLDFFLKAQ